ncbi:MAG: hypothetical protein HQ511_00850 [Rhodospirillales bacterium]|nr:hypothetical protein [Rhodospirillales bacterium]
MIKNLLIMALMAVFTLAVSYVMIPRPKEIALMQLKSNDFETARTSYEAQLAKGDYSVSVAVPLSEVYLHTGDIERAIGLMEKFLDHNPNHVTGLWRLGQYFKESQKPHGQVRALARLADLEHDEDVLRELAGRYDLLSNEDGEAEALEQLIEERDATVDEYDRLARHQASKGQLRKAIATLATLQDRHADTAEAESIELLISLKLDLGDTLGAVNIATESLETRKIQGLGVALAAVFAEKRRPDLALRILRPQTERFPNDITLLAAAVQYEAKLGNTQAALQRLQSFAQTRRLPESLAFDLIVLLMAENSPDQAIAVLQRQYPDRVPEWLVRTILTGSAELGRPDLPGMLAAFLGDSYFASHPVLAAEVFAAMNNKAEAEIWVSWAEQDRSHPYRDQLVLARLYYDVDRPKQGLALLKRLAAQTGSGTGNLSELADLYLTADRASDGLMIFERLRKSQPSKKTETAWARLAAKSRRAGPVLRWVRSTPDIAPKVLEEIFRSADRNRQPALALAAAKRLQAVDPGVKERRLRARAYAALGNNERSKALFSGLIDDNVQLDSNDLAALSLIGATDHLDTYWSARGEGTDGNRLATMFADARRAAVRLVLPRLEKLARSKGGFWLDTYTESARLAGEMGQLKGFLKAEAERSNLSPEDTRKIATTLFDVAPADSVALFARMAAQNPKAWGDAYIDTLLGLDRTAELVRFLQSEVNRPGIPQSLRDNRLYALIDAGGARRRASAP